MREQNVAEFFLLNKEVFKHTQEATGCTLTEILLLALLQQLSSLNASLQEGTKQAFAMQEKRHQEWRDLATGRNKEEWE